VYDHSWQGLEGKFPSRRQEKTQRPRENREGGKVAVFSTEGKLPCSSDPELRAQNVDPRLFAGGRARLQRERGNWFLFPREREDNPMRPVSKRRNRSLDGRKRGRGTKGKRSASLLCGDRRRTSP